MKLVVVSYDFPPSLIANARRPALLAREMLARGHSVEVITREPERLVAAGDLEWRGGSGIVIHRIPDPVLRWCEKWGKRRIVRGLLRRLWPDEQILWVFKAARHLRKIKEPVTVVAYILPVSMLFLRLLVPARRFFFVYDYLESVTPFRREMPYEFFPHRYLVGILGFLERKTLEKTDRAVFTCEENRKVYISSGLCRAEKTVYIPQYCDPKPYAEANLSCDGKMIVSYIGYFNRDRSPETFLIGLRRFLDQEPAAAQRIAINCYGNGLGLHQHLETELHLEGIVNDCGCRTYDETISISANSHLLLLIVSPKHKLFFPSKVAEYLAARRPILALLPAGSEVAELLRRSGRGAWVCPDDDACAVASCLSEVWQQFQSGYLGQRLSETKEIFTENFVPVWETVLKPGSIS